MTLNMSNPILHFYDVDSRVVAFSTTRHGGVSRDRYGELNLNEFCGDYAQNVLTKRRLVATELGITATRIIVPHQVLGKAVRTIEEGFFDMSSDDRTALLDGIDGVQTQETKVCIGVSTADCIPVLLYDTVRHAASAVHAGWRGTVQRIAQQAVMEMQKAFGTRPSDIKAVIGPGISVANFEVGLEVYDAFERADFDMKRIAIMKEKWHIDLPLCNKLQLLQLGVPEANVQVASICTFDHVDEYFSARRLGKESGRIYTAIMLK